jgi:4-methylaminobutanoate oxidase (formaldehyde-forming)
MADERAQVVIVGGGVIGLSLAYHLGHLGVSEVVLLERDQLTSGSSWHAAGIVGPLRASMNLTRLAMYALELFVELESETGQATGYRRTGGVWLAQRAERMLELQRIKAMGDRAGLATEMVSPAEIRRRLPFIYSDDLAGGLWVEQDGQVNPVDLCMAYARGARALGVDIREYCRVDDIETRDGRATGVRLADGSRIDCDKLVICAGAWSRQLAAMAGIGVPLAACEHMYLVTEVIEGLPDPCPIIRDLDSGIYIKGDSGKLVLGAFEANPKPWSPHQQDAGFLMFDEDWEHAQPMLESGMRRSPLIAEHGITHFMNGPESFTPDTRQIMGRAPDCGNLFVAAGFNSIGIMSSAGVGKVMAEWIRNDEAPCDLWEVDIARCDPLQCDDDFLSRRNPEAVHNQFAMHWPYRQYCSGRDLRRSPWHEILNRQGAVFGAPTGWERPLWFARDSSEAKFEYSYKTQCWWAAAQREALHCQQHVSLFELSPFGKFDVSGADALAYLQNLCCGNLDVEIDRVVYSLMLNPGGGIEAEVTVTRLARDRFRVVGGAATRFKDGQWLRRHVASGTDVRVDDVSEDYAVLGVMGPASRALLEDLCDIDLSDAGFPFSSARSLVIGDCELLALRLSFVGELGWELHVPVARAESLLDRILRAGEDHRLGFAGHFALDACRLEVGYHHWGHDVGPDESPLEAGLCSVVDFEKTVDFIGCEALRAQARDGWHRQLRLCEVLGDDVLVLHDEPVYRGSEIVGHCTSGGRGFRTGKTLCFVMFYQRGLDRPAAHFIEIAGERFALEVLDRPPYQVPGK